MSQETPVIQESRDDLAVQDEHSTLDDDVQTDTSEVEAEVDDDYLDANEEARDLQMYEIYQALPVPEGEPDWNSGPPSTAEEYLQQVRAEAAACPRVTRVEISPERLAQRPMSSSTLRLWENPKLPEAAEWAQPSPSWVRQLLRDFHALRLRLEQLAEEQSPDDAGLTVYGKAPRQRVPVAADSGVLTGLTAEIMALEQVAIVERLESEAASLSPNSEITTEQCQRIFALAAAIARPISADTSAAFKSLLRVAATARSKLTSADDPQLAPLNVLLIVAGAYFAQDEDLVKFVDFDVV